MVEVHVVRGSYLAINREERFFCSLLTHALLSSAYFRKRFFALVTERCGVSLDAELGGTEVYSEAAWLRDHWRNLGDPKKWSDQLGHDRELMLADCLRAQGLTLDDVREEGFFKTDGKLPKVVTPGRWPLNDLHDAGLKILKWSFNAIPDFIFVSGSKAVILEAKVESKPAKLANGYSQEEVQEALCVLIPSVAPYLDRSQVRRLWLAPNQISPSEAPSILWSEVASIVVEVPKQELDEFSRTGLEKFSKRAESGNIVLG